MGLGKTVTTLTAIKRLMFEELDISTTLVVAPKRVVESVWEAESQKWEHLRGLTFSLVSGDIKKRKAALMKKADIYLISRDNIPWLCGLYGGSMLPFDMLVIDELSSFKSPKSVRFKALRAVQPSFRRVLGLTGTPSPNGLIDLWSQLYLLDRGERLGKFVSNYRDKYFKPGKRNGLIVYKYNILPEAEKEIHNKIADICLSMRAKDYLELPGRINNNILLDMPFEVKEKYLKFEKEQVLKLYTDKTPGELEITALNAAALSNKLLQFANGAIYGEEKQWEEVHEVKIEATKELIEAANGSPVLIAWTYRHDLERLKKALAPFGCKELDGDEDVRAWNRKEIPVLLMHPASGGHGLNLQAGGNTIIWFGQTWSLELEQQLNARLDRQGQEKAVVINKLIMRGTLDEDVILSQEAKGRTQDRLMEAVKARMAKYIHEMQD
jgi:SNF2 family DNA or RNA helicase